MRRKLSVSEYGIEDVETGEVHKAEDEEAVYERLGYQWIPPELRENRGELEAARARRASRSGGARRRPGRPPHAHDLVGRPRDARRDGRGRDGARSSFRRDLRSREAVARRPPRPSDGGDRGPERAARRDRGAPRHRGRHPAGRDARRGRRDARAEGLGDGLDPLRLRRAAGGGDAAARGCDREPACRLHRAPDGPEAEPPRAVRSRPRCGLCGGGRRRHVPRDQLATGPARPQGHASRARRFRPA